MDGKHKGSDPKVTALEVVESGRGVALGPNKWGVSWVPGSTKQWCPAQRVCRPQLVSACAGAEIPSKPMLMVAATSAMATLRAMFIVFLHLLRHRAPRTTR